MEESADGSVLVTRRHDRRVRIVHARELVHRHRKAALGRPLKPGHGDTLELVEGRGVEVAERAQLGGEAGGSEPVHGLAHLADRAALQAEAACVDDGLVPDVQRVKAGVTVETEKALTGTDGPEGEPASFGELAELGQQPRERLGLSDWIARGQEDPARDLVREEGTPIGGEEETRVSAQLEEGKRVATVRAHEPERRTTRLVVGGASWHGERPEEDGRRGEEGQQAQRTHTEREPPEVPRDGERPGAPHEQRSGLARDVREPGVPVGRSPEGERREGHGCTPQRRDEPEPRKPPDGIVMDDERVTAPPEQARTGPAEQGLFDVEALQNVEAPGDDEQHESALQSAGAGCGR